MTISLSDFTQEELEARLKTVEESSQRNVFSNPLIESLPAIETDKFVCQLQGKIQLLSQQKISDWKASAQKTTDELKTKENEEATNLISRLMQELSKYSILNEDHFREKFGNAQQGHLCSVRNKLKHKRLPHTCIEEILSTVKETLISLEHKHWAGILKTNCENEDILMSRISDLKAQYFKEVLENMESRNNIASRLTSTFVKEFTYSSRKDEDRWQLELEKELLAINDQIDSDETHVHRNVLENPNEEKYRLESTLNAIKNDSIREYKKALVQEKELREFNPRSLKVLDTLDYIGKDAKAAATRHFQQQYKIKLWACNYPDVTQIIRRYEMELEEEISTIFSSEVRDVKFKQGKRNHLFEFVKKQAISSAGQHLPVRPQNSKTSLQNISASGGPPSGPSKGIPYPARNWPLLRFPRCQLAIHFGLYRTLAGIVVPGTDDILILYDVSNCIYFDHPQLLLCSDDPDCTKYKPSQVPNILQSNRNLPYKAFISNKETFMRLEGMIACLFAALKMQTELHQKVEISDCVICIPQSLNENQRGAILDSARIAGLGNVTLINDTNAIALAFMLEKNWVKGNFMVANTSEGFIDAAYFIVNEGVVTCTGVSGEFFSQMGGRGIIKEFLSAFGIEYSKFKENILPMFIGYMQMKNGSASLTTYPVLQSVILAGNDEYTNNIQRVLNSDSHFNEKHVIQVSDKYAIFGAAYLTVLNNSNREGPIYVRWANLSKEPNSDLEILWRNLTAQQSKDELLSLSNKNRLLPGYLSAKDMAEMQKHFILNEKIQIHRAKIIMLNNVQYLETCVNTNPRPGINELRGVIATIRNDIETLDLTNEQLCDYDNNLDNLYDQLHRQSI
ncbi:unnamed protein product [Allacma fusca]|uniref:Uncharacterized protein n=1 Tax=Allacma fusca TaxID=39272 RepID=A0A8J2NUH3_9HEXA|nr:unnamed protein product [Allacma fusca]